MSGYHGIVVYTQLTLLVPSHCVTHLIRAAHKAPLYCKVAAPSHLLAWDANHDECEEIQQPDSIISYAPPNKYFAPHNLTSLTNPLANTVFALYTDGSCVLTRRWQQQSWLHCGRHLSMLIALTGACKISERKSHHGFVALWKCRNFLRPITTYFYCPLKSLCVGVLLTLTYMTLYLQCQRQQT